MSDKEYWASLKPPAAPSAEDVATFRKLILGDDVLLLGSTRDLLPLVTEAWDAEPVYEHYKILPRDWATLDRHFDTIIGDGVLHFSEKETDALLELVSQRCDRFVVRSFLKPSWEPKYAKYFPRNYDFLFAPTVHPVNEVYCFYVWDFQ